jgi:hypothetical protein
MGILGTGFQMDDDPDRRRNPLDVLEDEAWRAHADHDRLEELKAERDDGGSPQWQMHWDLDEGDPDWAALTFRPVDPTDDRLPVLIGRWSTPYLAGELEAWRTR